MLIETLKVVPLSVLSSLSGMSHMADILYINAIKHSDNLNTSLPSIGIKTKKTT